MSSVNLFSVLQKVARGVEGWQFYNFAKRIASCADAIKPHLEVMDHHYGGNEQLTKSSAEQFLEAQAQIQRAVVDLFKPNAENTNSLEEVSLPLKWLEIDPIPSLEWEKAKNNPSEFVKRNLEKILPSVSDIAGFQASDEPIILTYYDEKKQMHTIKLIEDQRAGPELLISIDKGKFDNLSWSLGIQSKEYDKMQAIFSRLIVISMLHSCKFTEVE